MPHDDTDSSTRRRRTSFATGPESATSEMKPGTDGLPVPACGCSCSANRLPNVRKQPSDVVLRRWDSATGLGESRTRAKLYHAPKTAVKPMLRLEFPLFTHASLPADQASRGHR